jgi:hypothetical protein
VQEVERAASKFDGAALPEQETRARNKAPAAEVEFGRTGILDRICVGLPNEPPTCNLILACGLFVGCCVRPFFLKASFHDPSSSRAAHEWIVIAPLPL